MEVRREFFTTKRFLILLGLSLALTACGRGGGFKTAPSGEFLSQEGKPTPSPSATPTPENPQPESPDTKPPGNSAPPLPAKSVIPAAVEKHITRLNPTQDLPLVAGRIDIRDVDSRTTVLERLGGLDYRFSCGNSGTPGSQDVVLKKDLALLVKREGQGGDSLRREFEFALIRCR
ncbi:MAG: hypothetical protein KF789_04005 [Bdellovibrionaceae bacterium]|nr:hypothetical protein [Pseudobdellovibrionaceae bacterium]